MQTAFSTSYIYITLPGSRSFRRALCPSEIHTELCCLYLLFQYLYRTERNMGFGIYIFLLVIVGYEVFYSSGYLLDPFISIESLRTHFSRKQDSLYETHYYTQMLDHFTFVSEGSRTFQQRYLVNKTYWGGPHTNSRLLRAAAS